MWEASVKALALKHHILHLNRGRKKDLIFTHTFEMEAAHDYNILGFVRIFRVENGVYTGTNLCFAFTKQSNSQNDRYPCIFNRMMWDD